MTSPIARDPRTLLRALAAHARRRGVRQIEASDEGVAVLDGVGRRLPVRLDGQALADARRDLLGMLRLMDEPGRSWLWREHEDQGELGEWDFKDDGAKLVIRPRKPSPACVDALFKTAPEGMDLVRALYGRPGVGIVVTCEGLPRARDLAQALVAELAAFGAPVTFEQRVSIEWSHARQGADEHMGVEPFDEVVREDAAPADVVLGQGVPERAFHPPTDATRFTVVADGRDAWRMHRPGQLDGIDGAVAVVRVALSPEDSAPRITVAMTEAAAKLAAYPLPTPGDAPWVTYRAARERRAATRTPKPRTWHQTTEQVARAYAAREAPRGFVSGRALYFHGPVAYSLYDSNPVSAYVLDRDGGTVLLTGRDYVGTPSGKATVSMACDDVSQAVGGTVATVHLGASLAKAILWDGDRLESAAWRSSRAKDEGGRPRHCTVCPEAMAREFARRLARLEAERDKAFKPNLPTLAHARAIKAMADLVDLRDWMADRLAVDLPPLADAAALRAWAANAFAAKQAHVSAVAARKAGRGATASAADAEAHAPAP